MRHMCRWPVQDVFFKNFMFYFVLLLRSTNIFKIQVYHLKRDSLTLPAVQLRSLLPQIGNFATKRFGWLLCSSLSAVD
jgi:hypothetical protein